MPVIIDYRIRLDGVPRQGEMEFTGDLLPNPGDSFALSIDNRNLDAVISEMGHLSPYRGRLHVAMRFKDFPVKGILRVTQWFASALDGR